MGKRKECLSCKGSKPTRGVDSNHNPSHQTLDKNNPNSEFRKQTLDKNSPSSKSKNRTASGINPKTLNKPFVKMSADEIDSVFDILERDLLERLKRGY